MQPHKIVSHDEWLAARKAHLADEKAYLALLLAEYGDPCHGASGSLGGTGDGSVAKATATHGAYRYRVVFRRGAQLPVFLTDDKVHELPAAAGESGASGPKTKKARATPAQTPAAPAGSFAEVLGADELRAARLPACSDRRRVCSIRWPAATR